MELTAFTALIGLCCTIIGCMIGVFGFKRNQTNDIKVEAEEDTRDKVQLNTKIDVLLSNNAEIKDEVLANEICFDTIKGYNKEWNINGETVVIGVEKENA